MIKDFFSQNGPLSKEFEEYECRPQQVAMAEAVAASAKGRKSLLVEAGTGVGKSLGYLVPILERIREFPTVAETDIEGRVTTRPRRLLISTASKNLQTQLMEKELPMLKKFFPFMNFAMAVGTENYLCGKRLNSALADVDGKKNPLLFGMEGPLEMIRDWSRKTVSGLRMDLPEQVDHQVWSLVNRQADLCKCKTFDPTEPCFHRKARAMLQAAHVVVANHHLLMAHLTIDGGRVLPEFDYLVVDEIHALQNIADDFFGHEVSSSRIDYLVKDARRVLRGLELHRMDEVHEILDRIATSSDKLFRNLRSRVEIEKKDAIRLRAPILTAEEIDQIEVIGKLSEASEWLKSVAESISDGQKQLELRSLARRSAELSEEASLWLLQTESDYVYQIVLENGGKRVVAKSNPIDLAPHLGPLLFGQDFTVIGTSATIATNGNMSFIKSKIGAEKAEELVLASPFDFEHHALLYVAADLPEAKFGGGPDHAYYDAMVKRVVDLLSIPQGRAMVLCTSNQSMKTLSAKIKGLMPHLRFLVQGEDMERHRMIEELKKDHRTVLFGLDSFWQGVDVAGDDLLMVVIIKMPFPSPGDPLFEARSEKVDQARHPRDFMASSFMKLSLPEATIKLKQGFGRLIRTARDWGCVAVLDPRIVTKKYSKSVLRSLPRVPICYDAAQVKDFFYHRMPEEPVPVPDDGVAKPGEDGYIDEVPF